jgi:hypothetical protein
LVYKCIHAIADLNSAVGVPIFAPHSCIITTEARIRNVEAAFDMPAEGNNKISHRHSDKFGERIAQVRNPDVAM